MTVIVDYGMGNEGSVLNMYRKVGGHAALSSDPDTIAGAEKLILRLVEVTHTDLAKITRVAARDEHEKLRGTRKL
jgi:glutamine amidotransferase